MKVHRMKPGDVVKRTVKARSPLNPEQHRDKWERDLDRAYPDRTFSVTLDPNTNHVIITRTS
jgi:hypothetical protein